MDSQNITLTKKDFESSQWEELISKCSEKECNKYSMHMPYFWHLVLRLCGLTLIDWEKYEKEKQKSNENDGTNDMK